MADLTTGKIAKAIGTSQIGDSQITDNGVAGIAIAGPLNIAGVISGTSLVVSGLLQAGTTIGISTDVLLARTAANSLALRNGTNPQAFRAYNTYTDPSNGEWAYLGDWASNVARYGTDKNGTGVARDVSLVYGGVERLRLTTSGIGLPGSGQITAAGELGLGTIPLTRLHVGGTYSGNSAGNYVLVDGTFASSYTGQQIGLNVTPAITPTGASVGTITGLLVSPALNTTALNINVYFGVNSIPSIGAGYSGVVTTSANFSAGNPTISGGAVNNIFQYTTAVLTTNDGLAAGTKTNVQFNASGITAGVAGGTINNRGVQIVMPSGTAPASGTVNNRGLYITGNGGAAGSGTVVNYALLSDSTALSVMQSLRIGLQTGAANPTATVATTPFMYITASAGVPTGTPRDAAAGSIALQWDSANKKLMVYDQPSATWKGIVLA